MPPSDDDALPEDGVMPGGGDDDDAWPPCPLLFDGTALHTLQGVDDLY